MTLRNALSNHPDCTFIDNQKIDSIKPIVPNDYLQTKEILYNAPKFSHKYDPKTIIYIIEYKSNNTTDYFKKTVIIPIKNNFDLSKNGFGKYFDKMINDIRDKGGMIYNCLWFAWNSTFPDSKVIEL